MGKLHDRILRQVAAIDDLIAGQDGLESAELERLARTLGILVRVLEKLGEIDLVGGDAGAASARSGDSEDDIEQLRERLARRIARLRAADADPVPCEP